MKDAKNKEVVIPFGKYKGVSVKKIPDTYVAWLLHDKIARGFLKSKLEEEVWRRILENKENLMQKWTDDHYVFKNWDSYNNRAEFGDVYQDNGYDCPYDEFDAFGNLTVDFGF